VRIVKLFLAGGIAGGAAGYAYYYFIGCNGACAITANPLISTVYGLVIGLLIASIFHKSDKSVVAEKREAGIEASSLE